MDELIKKKPSVSELTGIEESRLGSVVSHLRLYLMGSVVPNIKGCPVPTPDSSSSSGSSETTTSSASSSSLSLRARHSGTHLAKSQGSISCSPSSFEENTLRNSSLRISSRDESKQSSEDHFSIFEVTTSAEGFIQSEEEGEEAADDGNGIGQILFSEAADLGLTSLTLPPQFPMKMVEKGARETLRLLISGANATTSAPLNHHHHGSRGLYSGTRDVSGVSLFAPIGLKQPSAGDEGDGSGDSGSSGEAVPPKETSSGYCFFEVLCK